MRNRSSPSFIVQSHLGVYYFQRRLPIAFRSNCERLPSFIRLSLKTKRRSLACRLARTLAAMMDERAKKFFANEDAYHQAMVLFERYVAAQSSSASLTEMQSNFFDSLDDTTGNDSELLEQAARYYRSKQLDQGLPNESQIASLAQLLLSAIGQKQDAGDIQSPSSAVEGGVLLSAAFETFIERHRVKWKASGGMEAVYRQSIFPVLLGVIGDLPTSRLTKAHINDFITVVQRMPKNKTKFAAYRDVPVKDFVTLEVPLSARMSPKSVEKYLSMASTFLKWLRINDHTSVELHLPIKSTPVRRERAVDQKNQFTSNDLRLIFNSKQYVCGSHKFPAHHWVPLLGIFTGARLNEICQLAVADISKEHKSKRWVMNINEVDGDVPHKSIKRSFHTRLVPLHKTLIDLGFLDFVEHQRKANQKRLFPELTYNEKANKYGDKLQRWFNRTYLKNCGVTTPKTSFHSLRHTVISHLVNDQGIDANQIAVPLGQTPSGGVTQTTYAKRPSLEHYVKHFDMIDFEKCFSVKKIIPWGRTHTSRMSR